MAKITLKTGKERFHYNGKAIHYQLRDFWQWSVSDLVSNITRGKLAEFIVATALQVDLKELRNEWLSYDLLTPQGIKVEVKSASFIQSWEQKKISTAIFSAKQTKYWNSQLNSFDTTIKFQADIYVCCLLKHLDRSTIDPLNLDQWEFYILSARDMYNFNKRIVALTLKSLKKITTAVGYDKIRSSVIDTYNGEKNI
jgi:hypothetical protein